MKLGLTQELYAKAEEIARKRQQAALDKKRLLHTALPCRGDCCVMVAAVEE
jgi:hypothetical protein